MSRLPENSRFLRSIVCAFLFVFIFCGASFGAQMDLMQGDARRGTVEVMDRDGMRFVALDDVMSRLAFASTPVGGGFVGFVVTYTGRKIEFWNGTNVARVNGSVSPLPAAVSYDGSHWWGEAQASIQAIKLFLASVSRPDDIRLEPVSRTPSRNIPVAPVLPAAPPPVAGSAPSVPSAGGGDGVLISRVRWGEQVDAYRAVVDVSGQAEASMTESPGRVDVTFKGTGTIFVSGKSPWPSLSAEARKQGDDVILSFTHSSEKVRGFWVADPPRYVVDFYFTGSGPEPMIPPQPPSDGPVAVPVPPPVGNSNSGTIDTTPKRGSPSEKKKFLVVVDAGHGGHDGGAVGNKLKEKDLNLLAALQLGISLKAAGMDVKLTRQDDRYLKLAERTEFANSADADVFISLHCNALPKGKHATGTELYLMAEQTDQDALNLAILENRELSGGAENAAEVNEAADKRTRLLLKILGDMQQSDKINESTTLAEFIYDKMRASGMQIRKVRQAPFFVLRGAGMPALLVEMGYITEAGDAKKLNSQPERKKMMDAIASGVINYLNKRPGEGGN
jgi:N-acetylmuramoyl-L-alanine amidase